MAKVKLTVEIRLGWQGKVLAQVAVWSHTWLFIPIDKFVVLEAVLKHVQMRVPGGRWVPVGS